MGGPCAGNVGTSTRRARIRKRRTGYSVQGLEELYGKTEGRGEASDSLVKFVTQALAGVGGAEDMEKRNPNSGTLMSLI